MSAHLNDFASAVAVRQAVAPSVHTATLNGAAIDLIDSDGECFAVQQVGSFEEGPTWSGRIEQSATGTSGWTTISGATFANVTEGSNTQSIRFTRTQRYVRYAASLTGTGPQVYLAVVIGAAKKTY